MHIYIKLIRSVCIVLMLAFLKISPTAYAADAKFVSIMCLGDSITEGGETFKTYRLPLNKMLKEAGYHAIFIGPKNDGLLNHAGYSGMNTEFLDEAFDRIVDKSNQAPDIILLHSAHNHFNKENPVNGIIASLESIIGKARKRNPSVIILLAQGITSGKLPKYSYIPMLNLEIEKLVKKLHKVEQPVILVDQAEDFDWKTDTIPDRVHPNEKGAEKMAVQWFNALIKLNLW